MPGPQVCVSGCLRVVTRGMAVGGRFSGASGTPPPTACPGMGGSGSLPLIRPCGATFPQGGRQGLLLAAAGVSAGGNPGKDVGASLRGAAGTPPPAGCPGMGGSGSLPLIRPCGATFPQGGRQGLLLAAAGGRGGVGAPRPTDGDMETPAGFTRTPVPGPPHGRGRACPARGGYAGPRQWFGP